MATATFHEADGLEPADATLIEGLPGLGLVASIAVDRITDQLGLNRYGTIRSDAFPPVASFADGIVQDTVRVYAGTDPDVMTLQSDVPLPEDAFRPLSQCVIEDLAGDVSRAIFLAGAPAQSDAQRGEVIGIATNQRLREELVAADVDVMEASGAVGGVTGALVTACHHAGVPAMLLLVRTDPRLPDPGAARSVVEGALEPLVDFDIDTSELSERAEEIQEQKQQIAHQLQQARGEQAESMQAQSMFQ